MNLFKKAVRGLAIAGASTMLITASAAGASETIKAGVLHSLSGTMAISEITVKNAEMLAIEEINATGGVMGKQIQLESLIYWRKRPNN